MREYMSNGFFFRVGRLLPKGLHQLAEEKVRQAGYVQEYSTWVGKTILVVLLAGMVGGLSLWASLTFVNEWLNNLAGVTLSGEAGIIIGLLLGFLLGLGGRALQLYYAIENRRRKVEEILPDFLLMVAGNIRAGMTSFSAFKSSTRPEFGPLSEEIRSVTTRSLGTESFGSALASVSQKIKSSNLNETVRFFLQAVRSGGKIAELLESAAVDLRRTQDLRKELESSTRTYIVFIAFVMVIATPLLMAVSVEFVALIARIQGQSALGNTASTSFSFLGQKLSITPHFLESMAFVLLMGNAILAGIFMGLIGGGKPWLGLRFTPIMVVVSFGAYFVAKAMLAGLLGG